MMPIAVVGCSGQVASALDRVAARRQLEIIVRGRPDVDLCNAASLAKYLDAFGPGLVVNAAAYTGVDQAESDAAAAFAVNADGPATLAQLCATRGLPLIHISTDYVFDGAKGSPYVETDNVAPLGVYGASKAAGEQAIRAALRQHIIVRTSWLYGLEGRNFVKTMMRLARERDEVSVVADQRGCPTFADDLASAILDIAAKIELGLSGDQWGTYHLTGDGETTWHGFAAAVFAVLGQAGVSTPHLVALSTEQYPTPARRPAYSLMDCGKIERAFGIKRAHWTVPLKQAMQQMLPAVQN